MEALQISHEVFETIVQAQKDLIRSAARRMLKDQIRTGNVQSTRIQEALKFIPAQYFISEETRGRKKDTKCWFITVSAKEDIDYYKFINQMEKCLKKQKLSSVRGYYVLEQRSESDQEPYGFHIHWLVEFKEQSSGSTIQQQVYQCFQNFVAGSNYIDRKPVYDECQWEEKLKYIKGEKNKIKQAKVLKDIIFRDKHRIPHLFSH